MAASMTLRQEPTDRPVRPAGARGTSIKPPPRVLGTQAHECPKRHISPHIRAYSRSAPSAAPVRSPASCHIRSARLLEIGVIAMQKVESSDLFSRLSGKAPL
jgi:hypothetical protein